MARDAVARQADVDEQSVVLTCESDEGRYRPGKIVFRAREGRSIHLGQIQQLIAATRLSGHTNMRVDYLEITVRGKLVLRDGEPMLEVPETQQVFELAADDRELERRLIDAAQQGLEGVTAVGRVDAWSGRFPVVLRVFAKRYGTDDRKPVLLVIQRLETEPAS